MNTLKEMNIEIESNQIDVTPCTEPNPNWSKECDCGVVHKYHSDDPDFNQRPGMCHWSLPTLKWVVSSEATEDYPECGHYECKECDERVFPETRMPIHAYHISGRRSIRVNGKEVSEEEFQKLINENS